MAKRRINKEKPSNGGDLYTALVNGDHGTVADE